MPTTSMPLRRNAVAAEEMTALAAGAGPPANRIAARRMLLCYTGASRFSGATIGRVMAAYERGDPAVAGALDGIRGVAETMPGALLAGDLARIGTLLSANWRLQQALETAQAELRAILGRHFPEP